MTTCTIIISHYESKEFLFACLRQMNKHSRKDIEQQIIVVDQSSPEYSFNMGNELLAEFGNRSEIMIVQTLPLYSGFGIDWVMRNVDIKTEYIAQYHCDAFPVSDKHLYIPIKLIEEYNLSFVGQLHFVNYESPVYPPHPFFSMSPTFNVARYETYKEMSLEAGFTRFHNRRQSGLAFKNNDWAEWAREDYQNRGSDDDTVAFWWESVYRNTNKLGLAISGYIEPNFGRIIDGLVFHFCSANEARGVMEKMPILYQEYTKKINENYSNELISEMINLAKVNKPNGAEILSRNYWDGKLKQHFPTSDELNKRIEELKL